MEAETEMGERKTISIDKEDYEWLTKQATYDYTMSQIVHKVRLELEELRRQTKKVDKKYVT
jgi:hypothetical protein